MKRILFYTRSGAARRPVAHRHLGRLHSSFLDYSCVPCYQRICPASLPPPPAARVLRMRLVVRVRDPPRSGIGGGCTASGREAGRARSRCCWAAQDPPLGVRVGRSRTKAAAQSLHSSDPSSSFPRSLRRSLQPLPFLPPSLPPPSLPPFLRSPFSFARPRPAQRAGIGAPCFMPSIPSSLVKNVTVPSVSRVKSC